jgi:hypothetical protein
MKKFITMGALSLAVAAVCSAPAPAWLNWRFGIGLNFGWQSGGNNTMWGLFRNGQPPGPDCCPGGGCGLPPAGPGPGIYGGGFQPNSMDNRGVDAAAAPRAVTQSYQSFQAPWSNYYSNTSAVNYRYNYNPYYNYGYNNGYYYYSR